MAYSGKFIPRNPQKYRGDHRNIQWRSTWEYRYMKWLDETEAVVSWSSEEIVIPVELLPKGSHYKIKCKCDSCGVEKEVIYKNYLKYGNNWGEYYCRKCSEVKRKETLRKNFGVDYPIQNEKVLQKMKKTLVEKYGVDNISKNKKKLNNE